MQHLYRLFSAMRSFQIMIVLYLLIFFFLRICTRCSNRHRESQTQEPQQFPSLAFHFLLLTSLMLISMCPFHQITKIVITRQPTGPAAAKTEALGQLSRMSPGSRRWCRSGCRGHRLAGCGASRGSGRGGWDERPGYGAGLFLSLFRISFVLVRQSSCWRQ